MKNLSLFILSVITLITMANCSSDSEPRTGNKEVRIKINVMTVGNNTESRATRDQSEAWDDKNATNGEMMRNCFVVIVQNGIIKDLIKSDEYNSEQSNAGRLTTKIETGKTIFYSFANLHPKDIGLDPDIDYAANAIPLPTDFDKKLYTVYGNMKNASDFTNGIPMSNKQTVTITESTQEVDLEVIRMVAKVKLQITNDTDKDITVKSLSISDITANEENNIYLLPGTDNGIAVEPNINENARKETYNIALDKPLTIKANNNDPTEISFYVNESVASTPKYFVINIETNQTKTNHRVALMKWNTISRNDFLVIPIRLNDFRITFDVEQFTAIGVLPSVENDNNMLTVKFKSYGEFHIIPHVTRLSDGKELTPGTDAKDGWTFAGWSLTEMSPYGNAGICIYDRMPTPEQSRHSIEGYIGNRSGYAIHQLLVHVSGVDYEIPYKVQIIKE